MNKPFTADQFTPTKFSTAEDKAKFANHFVRFVEGGYKWSVFPKWFYNRLSMCFGHIAHYNRLGFYETFFLDNATIADFKRATMGTIYGDPAWTHSDVERALQGYFKTQGWK